MPEYQKSLELLKGYNPSLFGAQTSSAVASLLSGRPSYSLDPTTTANYYKSNVVAPGIQTYNREIAPRIDEAFAGVQAFSSAQGSAKSRALSDLNVGFNQQLSQIQYQNQALQAQLAESARNRQLQGISAAQSLTNQPIAAALGYQQALAPFQQNLQQQGQAQYNEFLRQTPEQNPWLQQAQGYLGQSQSIAYQNPSFLSQALGGVLGVSALGQALPGAVGAVGQIGGFGLGLLGLPLGL